MQIKSQLEKSPFQFYKFFLSSKVLCPRMIDADRVVLSPLIVPTHYSLVLSPDFVALEFGCDEEITLTIAEASIKIGRASCRERVLVAV